MLECLKRNSWLLFALGVIFVQLGQRGLNEPDEGRYAEVAREMTVDGDWLLPHMNGIPHVQKPPVIYWLTALSLRSFGHNEWAARFPSALMAVGTVILTFLLARRLFPDPDRAAISALVLTSLGGFFAMSRLLTPDMTMTFWIMAAITSALYGRRWSFFTIMGIGFLTKGPMALVVPVCAVLGWELFSRKAEKIGLPWFRGLLVTLIISLSWFLALAWKEPALFRYFWQYELVQRFASGAHGRSKPVWFFLAILPLVTMPWIFFLPVRRIWQRVASGRVLNWQGLLLAWFIPPLLILSLSGSKLPTYILPLMPAFALLIGCVLPSLRQAWTVALPTAVCLIFGDLALVHFNGNLGVQGSSRDFARILQANEPDAKDAILFCCGTRTQGLAFYMDRLAHTTRAECDCVLPLTETQSELLYQSASDCAKLLTEGPPAHGIVTKERFLRTFDPKKWRVIAENGPFVLVANHPEHSSPYVIAGNASGYPASKHP